MAFSIKTTSTLSTNQTKSVQSKNWDYDSYWRLIQPKGIYFLLLKNYEGEYCFYVGKIGHSKRCQGYLTSRLSKHRENLVKDKHFEKVQAVFDERVKYWEEQGEMEPKLRAKDEVEIRFVYKIEALTTGNKLVKNVREIEGLRGVIDIIRNWQRRTAFLCVDEHNAISYLYDRMAIKYGKLTSRYILNENMPLKHSEVLKAGWEPIIELQQQSLENWSYRRTPNPNIITPKDSLIDGIDMLLNELKEF